MFDLVSHRRTSQSHAIHIHADVVMERAHAAMAMGLTPTQAHTYTNMHTHACFPQQETIQLLRFASTLIDTQFGG